LIRIAVYSPLVDRAFDSGPMADFLAVLGFVGFTVVMLALIWALDRV
jgi:hypothetical protein